MEYVAWVVKAGTSFNDLYEIPLLGIDNQAEAIEVAKEISKTLKKGYAVRIEKIERKHIGYVNGGEL